MSATPSTPSSTKTSAEEQVKFLLACMKHSTNWKPDFGKVSEQMTTDDPSKPLSKGAVAKRFQRLLKANGIPSLSEQAGQTKRKNSAAADADSITEGGTGGKKRKTTKKTVSATPDDDAGAETARVKAETYSDTD